MFAAHNFLSLALDPRFKGFGPLVDLFRVQAEYLTAYGGQAQEPRTLIDSIVARYDSVLYKMMEAAATARATVPPPNSSTSGPFDDRDLFASHPAEHETCSLQPLLQAELSSFRRLQIPFDPVARRSSVTDVFGWWRTHKEIYPHLFICFLGVFAMQGSEIEAERIFSICGILTQLRRNRLGDVMLDQLVFLNKNWPDSDVIQQALSSEIETALANQEEQLEELQDNLEDIPTELLEDIDDPLVQELEGLLGWEPEEELL